MQRRNILHSPANHRNDTLDRVTAYSGRAVQTFVNGTKHPAAHEAVCCAPSLQIVGAIIPWNALADLEHVALIQLAGARKRHATPIIERPRTMRWQ
jgi:hypothetical protein